MEMKKTKSTLSALTLLAFLFFLNLLLSCLKDTVQSGNPEIIVMPQQRVTRGVLSGQLTGAVAPGGVQGDDDEEKKKVAEGSIWSRIVERLHYRGRSNGSRVAAGRDADNDTREARVADSSIWRRTGHGPRSGITNGSRGLDMDNEEDDDEMSVESAEEVVGRRGYVTNEIDLGRTQVYDDDDEDDEMSVETEEEVVGRRGYPTDELDLGSTQVHEADELEGAIVGERSLVDRPRAKFWPCCSDSTARRARTARQHDDYETSLETPEVVFRYAAGGHADVYRMAGFPRRGPLEPGHLGWETVEDATPSEEDTGLVLVHTDGEGLDHRQTEVEGKSENKDVFTGKENVLAAEQEDDSDIESKLADWEESPSGNLDDVDEAEDEDGLVQVTQATPWDAVKALLRAIGRRVAGKGWEESLESLQVPGSQFFKVGDKLATYAMPIVRDTSTRLGLARCKELVVCETSRLSEMFADEEVTDIFHGVFKWIYGMKEPELRSIAKDGEKKNNCKHFVRRCKSETDNRSWLPMIANLLDFFVT